MSVTAFFGQFGTQFLQGARPQDADGAVRGYVRQSDGSLVPENFYGEFIRGLQEIGYEGYLGYELCHPLPKVDGQTVGVEFADKNARLAADYMRALMVGLGRATDLVAHREPRSIG